MRDTALGVHRTLNASYSAELAAARLHPRTPEGRFRHGAASRVQPPTVTRLLFPFFKQLDMDNFGPLSPNQVTRSIFTCPTGPFIELLLLTRGPRSPSTSFPGFLCSLQWGRPSYFFPVALLEEGLIWVIRHVAPSGNCSYWYNVLGQKTLPKTFVNSAVVRLATGAAGWFLRCPTRVKLRDQHRCDVTGLIR